MIPFFSSYQIEFAFISHDINETGVEQECFSLQTGKLMETINSFLSILLILTGREEGCIYNGYGWFVF